MSVPAVLTKGDESPTDVSKFLSCSRNQRIHPSLLGLKRTEWYPVVQHNSKQGLKTFSLLLPSPMIDHFQI